MDPSLIFKYFPTLDDKQRAQIEQLGPLYEAWNARINVISRKDIGNLYPNHVLHSLAIAKFLGPLQAHTSILDMGTGGGFPGIPLAIVYPQCSFHLIDRIGKKVRVAEEIAKEIGLENVTVQHGDIGECRDKYNYVVSRAVMALDALVPLVRKNIKPGQDPGNIYPNGIVCLKGGDISAEKAGVKGTVKQWNVIDFIPEQNFEEKLIVYVK